MTRAKSGSTHIGERAGRVTTTKFVRVRHGFLAGSIVALTGLVASGTVVVDWLSRGLGSLAQERLANSGATLLVLGAQILFTSFLLSVLGLRDS